MHESEIFDAPVLNSSPPAMEEWEKERAAFRQLLPQLLPQHEGKNVAIYRGEVVDVGDDRIDLAMRVYQKHGYVPIYIGRVSLEPEPAVRIPHFREVVNARLS
jgi:hypothetical protein